MSIQVAQNVIHLLLESASVELVNPYFSLHLIEADHDDDKFVDCAFAANATYIVSDDSHFDSYDDDAVRMTLLSTLFDSHWKRMSYVHYSLWEPLVPKEGDGADKLGKNCQILYIENGTHNDAIDTWNASERNQLFQWLKGLGFDL